MGRGLMTGMGRSKRVRSDVGRVGCAAQMTKPKVEKTDAEWRASLTPTQYKVLREKGTEPAFTGQYWDRHGDGSYTCAGCGERLFVSDTKFDSGCGWPSFSAPAATEGIDEHKDTTFGMVRTDVTCARCGG